MKHIFSAVVLWTVCGTELLGAAAAAAAAAPTVKVSALWKFPVGTWIENIAIRSNEQLLVTENTAPKVYQVDPTRSKPASLVATIPHHLTCLGITETSKDVFYVTSGNNTVGPDGNFAPGTHSIWKIDVSSFKPGHPVTPVLIANFPKAGFLNGLTTASNKYLLVGDSTEGAIWRLNVQTGKKEKVLQDALLKPKDRIGVNGVLVEDGILYFVNLDKGIFGQVSIDSAGLPIGRPKTIITGLQSPDDFDLSQAKKLRRPAGFVAGNNSLQRFARGKTHVLSVDRLLEGATSVAISRPGVAYVTRHGGDEGKSLRGMVLKVTVDHAS